MYENIPNWLVGDDKYQIFCTHKDKKPTHNTHTNDQSTFYTYSQAIRLMQPDEGLGVGLFGNLCGIDIDHALMEDGTLSEVAQDIINYFDGAYMEYSYSGKGVHILFFCKEQHDYKKYYKKMNPDMCASKGLDIGGLEFYQGKIDNRYLTLTGNIIPQTKANNYTVSHDKLIAFLDKYLIRKVPTISSLPIVCNDEEDIAWFNWARLRRPERLIELASKTPAGSGSTESEDDLAFCQELAFWCNKNPNLIREAFSASSYCQNKDESHQAKWYGITHKTYAADTISKAIAFCDNTAKEFFKDSFEYNSDTKSIIPVSEGGDDMIAPKYSTRISQKGDTIHVLETKRFKFEVSDPQARKDSTERYVKWVSVYEKGSQKPTSFIDRKDPAFELAAGIILGKED